MIGTIQMLVPRTESGDGRSLARGHMVPSLVLLVTHKWATLELMFEVGGSFVEATEPRALVTARPNVIVIIGVVPLSTTRSGVSVP